MDKLDLLIREIFKEIDINYDKNQAIKIGELITDYYIDKDWDLYNEYN